MWGLIKNQIIISEKNITNLNQLKNWFTNGSKPTQEHFWAWQESYWHKSESIPQELIQGLSESLGTKADAELLDKKADKDTTYTKEEVDNKVRDIVKLKADKPYEYSNVSIGGFINPLVRNGYVIGYEERKIADEHYDEVPVKFDVNRLGRSIENNNLRIPVGAVRMLDTSGAKLEVKGLENKKNDASFIHKIITNERGELAVSDEADITNNITVNIPQNVIVTHTPTLANTSYTPSPTTPQDIIGTWNFIKELEVLEGFIPFKRNEIIHKKLDSSLFPDGLKSEYELQGDFVVKDGMVASNNSFTFHNDFFVPSYQSVIEDNNAFHQFLFDKAMSSNKDWVVKFRTYGVLQSGLLANNLSMYFGMSVSRDDFGKKINTDVYQISRHWWSNLWRKGEDIGDINNIGNQLQIYLIKKGAIFTILLIQRETGKITAKHYDYSGEAYFRFGFSAEVNTISPFIIKDIAYYIND